METKNNQGKLSVTCQSCGKSFGIRVPAQPGEYDLKCPHCANSISITFTKQEPKQGGMANNKKLISAPRIVAPILGELEKVKDRVYIIKTRAIVNRPYRVVCPDCGTNIALLANETNKVIKASCKKCRAIVFFKAVEKISSSSSNKSKKTDEAGNSDADDDHQRKRTQKIAVPKGALTWKQRRGLLGKTKVARLRKGVNTMGRKDGISPSDIMIENDDEISRRSVAISVVYSDEKRDFIYELKVLRNVNPVYVNGRPINRDEIVRLNYNDIICLGRTNITFIQNKEKK